MRVQRGAKGGARRGARSKGCKEVQRSKGCKGVQKEEQVADRGGRFGQPPTIWDVGTEVCQRGAKRVRAPRGCKRVRKEVAGSQLAVAKMDSSRDTNKREGLETT